MTIFHNKTKKGAAALVIAAILALVMLFTACPNAAGGGGNSGGGNSGGGGTPTPPEAPFVEGSAVLILTHGTDTINVRAKTSDSSNIKVLGCIETELASGGTQATTLHVKKDLTKVILTGKIIELDCINNKLTALNVQGLTALEELNCSRNQLTALNVQGCSALKTLHCERNKLTGEAFTKIFTDLPARGASDGATCCVYSETKQQQGQTEGNCKDFTTPETLKNAFYAAKGKNWKMQKKPMIGDWEELDVPSVPGSAELSLTSGTTEIKVTAKTSDGNPVTVEGCTETELASGVEKTLTVKSGVTKVVLKGKIIELRCDNNYLTALNVQGLTALQKLSCYNNQLPSLNVQGLTALQELLCDGNQLTALDIHGLTALQELDCCRNQLTALNVEGCSALKSLSCFSNKLNAEVFRKLFGDLPIRQTSDDARCYLYTEEAIEQEENCTNFNTPASLKAAFDDAKGKNWKMFKMDEDGREDEIESAAVLTLGTGTTTITVKAKTSGGSAITVEGCTVATLASGVEKTLTVKPGVTDVIFKGKITELVCSKNRLTSLTVQGLTDLQVLDCSYNQLTALNVQGCSSLKTLYCDNNKLNAAAFTKIFTDLPKWAAINGATCHVYSKANQLGQPEGNCMNFTTPQTLKDAFENAKNVKKWKLQERLSFGWVDI